MSNGNRGRVDGHHSRGRRGGYRGGGRGHGRGGNHASSRGGSATNSRYYKIRYHKDYIEKGDFTTYNPVEIGSFSMSEEMGLFDFDKASFPTIIGPADVMLPIDMDVGYKPGVKYGRNAEDTFVHGEKALSWLKHFGTVPDIDVITRKGILKQIAHTIAQSYNDPWTLEVCKFRGKLYMKRPEAEEDEAKDEDHIRNSYWGVKFEEHVINRPEDESQSYKMLKGKVGNKKILISGEIDAISSDGRAVEVKTCFPDKIGRNISRVWIQAYLSGVEILYFGWKDRDPLNTKKGNGFVSKIPELFEIKTVLGSKEEIATRSNKLRPPFLERNTANKMMGFLSEILNWLFDALPEENTVSKMTLDCYDNRAKGLILEGSSVKFLPDWYIQFLDKLQLDDASKRAVDIEKQFESLLL